MVPELEDKLVVIVGYHGELEVHSEEELQLEAIQVRQAQPTELGPVR